MRALGSWGTRTALITIPATIVLALVGCGADATTPFESVVGLEFRSAKGVALTGVWAPVGQPTIVTVVARDASGAVVTDPRVSVHIADASAAELTVLPATPADSGRMRLEVRGTRLGAETRLIAIAFNGVADSTVLDVPLVGGVYDMTTQLQTFSFETAAPSPPDCPSQTLYCTHTHAFAGASMTGTLTIARDSVYGNFGGLFCSAWSLDGCSAVKSLAAMDYPYYSSTKVVTGPGSFPIWLRAQGADFTPTVSFALTFRRAVLQRLVARRLFRGEGDGDRRLRCLLRCVAEWRWAIRLRAKSGRRLYTGRAVQRHGKWPQPVRICILVAVDGAQSTSALRHIRRAAQALRFVRDESALPSRASPSVGK
jgi:hypothetical protein